MNFATKTLEFDKILNLVTPYATSPRVKQQILNLDILFNKQLIKEKLEEVSDALTASTRTSSIFLDPKYDIYHQVKRLEIGSVLTINELVLVKIFLRQEISVLNYFKNLKKLKLELPRLYKYEDAIILNEEMLNLLESSVDDEGLIYDHATTNLSRIRRQINNKLSQINQRLEKLIIKYSDFLNEKVIVTRSDRYCLCFNASFKNKIKGVIHDVSQSGQTVYIEPDEIRSIMAEVEMLRVEENQEVLKILADISKKLNLNIESIKNNLEIFLDLDLIFSKASYAIEIDGIIPKLNNEGTINLIKARHPLIDPKKIVPINFYLDKKAPTMIITGPNTGGKTVALKTVGLLTLMAQAGLLIPADDLSEISIFENIYADIGDEQSLEQSLSTFSSHITKIKTIIDNVTSNDLILIDELGSGTDPVEGTSLAIAILDYLRKYNPNLVVTTHYSELKVYAFEQSDIITASVAFDEETLEPKYHLQIGLTGSSNAILIANRLGIKEEIIKKANENVEGRQTDVAKVIQKLSKREQELDHQQAEFELLTKELQSKIQKYDELLEKNAKEQARVLKEIVDQETQVWNQKQLEIQKIIKELKSRQSISTKEEAEIKSKIRRPDQSVPIVTDYNFKVGDHVFILPYQQTGEIIEITGDEYLVDLGVFTLNFPKSDLQLTATPQSKPKKVRRTRKPSGITPEKKGSTELDLRGVRFEDVKPLLDKAIDDLILSGLGSLRIIHGYGTGAVKKAVYDYIKSSSIIKSHRHGGETEGMMGVTIVTI